VPQPPSRLILATIFTGTLLAVIFAAAVERFRAGLRDEIRQKIIERDAAVLYPVALQKLADIQANLGDRPMGPAELVAAVVKGQWSEGKGILAVTIFDEKGGTLRAIPESLLFADLPVDDFFRLQTLKPISRYHPQFLLSRYFAGMAAQQSPTPVLEVLLPLPGRDGTLLGFAQYYLDATPLAAELATIDHRYNRLTAATLGIGTALIALVMTAAYFPLHRAQRALAERNARLVRANFELTLAAKTSALGQITSHLIHGLQGPVAGLRAVVAGRETAAADAAPDWQSAADYTARMQTMIQETVALLGETNAQTTYELTGRELVATIRQRNAPTALQQGVVLSFGDGFDARLDSHRGSLLCLIATNLVQNAIAATPAGRRVAIALLHRSGLVTLTVADEGSGIPEPIRAHLFEPGRSGRPGGTGLGLAISHLLARQIGADLTLIATGPTGTTFRLTLPLA
jgi:signal transduction histidine kinase